MATPRLTKAEQAQRTRRNLLDAAGKLYFEHGFAAVSLDDIAAEAGVTKGAVYAHFASKEELLIALMSTVEPTSVDLSMFGTGGTRGDQVRAFARSIAESMEPKSIAVQADYVSIALRNPRAGEVFSRIINETITTLGSSVEAANEATGELSGTETVVIIDALLQGLRIRHALNPELVTDQVIEDALGLVFSALIIGVVDPDEAVAMNQARADAASSERSAHQLAARENQ